MKQAEKSEDSEEFARMCEWAAHRFSRRIVTEIPPAPGLTMFGIRTSNIPVGALIKANPKLFK